eukprot:5180020-Pyramimonas_sp.AAC.1
MRAWGAAEADSDCLESDDGGDEGDGDGCGGDRDEDMSRAFAWGSGDGLRSIEDIINGAIDDEEAVTAMLSAKLVSELGDTGEAADDGYTSEAPRAASWRGAEGGGGGGGGG